MGSSLLKVNSVLAEVDRKMEEFQDWVNYVKPTDMTAEIALEIMNAGNDIILDKSPAVSMEYVSERMEQLEGAGQADQEITEHVRSAMVELQDRIANSSINTLEVRVYSPADGVINSDLGSPKSNLTLRERNIVRKGIKRLERQILQLIGVLISCDQVDIELLKKCKTVDVPAINSAIGNVQKALEKYVGFEGMDSEYSDRIEVLMDQAQNWCLKIEDLNNKIGVHSINTLKGEAADVGVFSNNSQIPVFKFLETAELAYLGWGNSGQKANRLYNKHLSEEIKSHLINISDNYNEMKTWLISNYCGPSRIVGDIISNLSRKSKSTGGNRKEKFVFYSAITGALQRPERLSRVNYIDRTELESCLLFRSTLSSLVCLLPTLEHDLWVRMMTVAGLDFKNPVGVETFNCFRKV